jgi:hypothetical protein
MTVTTQENIKPTKFKSHSQVVTENVIRTFFRYLLLLAIGAIMLLPFIMAFLGTVKTDQEILAYPPSFCRKSGAGITGRGSGIPI